MNDNIKNIIKISASRIVYDSETEENVYKKIVTDTTDEFRKVISRELKFYRKRKAESIDEKIYYCDVIIATIEEIKILSN
jgi:hypothetical protein